MAAVRYLFTVLGIVIIAILVLSFMNRDVAHFRLKIAVDLTCKFTGRRACNNLFESYRGSPNTLDLAQRAGAWSCKFQIASACANLGQDYEADQQWPKAIDAYARACDLGIAKSCVDQLILLSGAGRLREGLARATEFCQNNIPTTCHLGGVLAQRMKNRASAEWAFHKGCYEQETAESCFALADIYIFKRKPNWGHDSLEKGCQLGLLPACLRENLMSKTALVAPDAATFRRPATDPRAATRPKRQ
jgi:hypothetical protein